MKRILFSLAIAALASAALASGASASGPEAPGKHVIEIQCEGGTVTVTLPHSERNNGAGQIVGAPGHGLASVISVSVTDVTTSTLLFSETHGTTKGRTETKQSTTTCKEGPFEVEASKFFGEELPPGVAATDTIRAEAEITVILKP